MQLISLFEDFVAQDIDAYMGDGCGSRDNCDCYIEDFDEDNDYDW